jgi:predicted AlkP superfamily phosphohydrolase/phosphomutase
LEAELIIRPLHRSHAFMSRSGTGVPKSYYALIYATTAAGYDRVRITRSRDGADRLFEQDLRAGEWTAYARDSFRIGDSDIAGHVRVKCIELTPDAERFELFVPQIWPLDGFTYPNAVAAELLEHVGPFLQNPGRDALGVIDDDTYFELVEHHLGKLADTAIHLCSTRPDWGGLFTQTHVPDYANHFFMADADAVSGQPAERVERCFQGMARSYAACDRWIGRLCEALLDDHTVICLVADHGGTPTSYPLVEVADVLEQTGFLVYTGDGNGGRVVDWTRTKAASVGNVNIYVNLKGREPTGIVEPADYEQVRRDIIHALNGYREPESGYCPFVFALRREDAEVANLWGELVGDVVYATLPEFTGAHGPQLPSARLGWGSQHTCFVMAGAGIKEGVHLQQQVRQVDVAPTLAYVTGLPRPRDAEGGVVAEALTDPDWYL